MKKCPKCDRIYMDYDFYCKTCNYRLEYIEGSEKFDYPPESHKVETIRTQTVTCPYCQSTRCSRISILGRMVSVEFWGFASNKLGKQWHCHDCGSNF